MLSSTVDMQPPQGRRSGVRVAGGLAVVVARRAAGIGGAAWAALLADGGLAAVVRVGRIGAGRPLFGVAGVRLVEGLRVGHVRELPLGHAAKRCSVTPTTS